MRETSQGHCSSVFNNDWKQLFVLWDFLIIVSQEPSLVKIETISCAAGIHLLKVNNKNFRKKCQIRLKLNIKT